MESTYEQIDERPKRPTFLKVLCILTFINLGIALISAPIQLLTGPQSSEQMALANAEVMEANEEMRAAGMNGVADLLEQVTRMSTSLNANFYAVFMTSFLVTILGLTGAIMMWKGRKLGFHLYIIYNLVAIAYLYLFVSPSDIPTAAIVLHLIFSGVFIFMYSRNLKWMK